METNPLLARRVIPLRERLQKAVASLLLTALLVGGAWYVSGMDVDEDLRLLAGLVSASVIGTALALYFALHKHEVARSKEQGQAIRQRIADDRRGAAWFTRIGFETRRLAWGMVFCAGLMIALAGLGILAVQGITYLRTGQWHSQSILVVLYPFVPWLRDPQSWIGLHRLVYQFTALVPVSFALVLSGWLVAGFGSNRRQRVKRKGP